MPIIKAHDAQDLPLSSSKTQISSDVGRYQRAVPTRSNSWLFRASLASRLILLASTVGMLPRSGMPLNVCV